MNKEWEKVKEFQIKANHPTSQIPTQINKHRVKTRYNWMLEELNEFLDAEDIVEQADAIIDLMYFALGTLVEMGITPDDLFDVVHKANMSKIGPNNERIYDNNSKILKPQGWIDPYKNLEQVINIQKNKC